MHLYTFLLFSAGVHAHVAIDSRIENHNERYLDYTNRMNRYIQGMRDEFNEREHIIKHGPQTNLSLMYVDSLFSEPWHPDKNRLRTIGINNTILYRGSDLHVPTHFLISSEYHPRRILEQTWNVLSGQEVYGVIRPKAYFQYGNMERWIPHSTHIVPKDGIIARIDKRNDPVTKIRRYNVPIGQFMFQARDGGKSGAFYDNMEFDLHLGWRAGGANGDFLTNVEVRFDRVNFRRPDFLIDLCYKFDVLSHRYVPGSTRGHSEMVFEIQLGATKSIESSYNCLDHYITLQFKLTGAASPQSVRMGQTSTEGSGLYFLYWEHAHSVDNSFEADINRALVDNMNAEVPTKNSYMTTLINKKGIIRNSRYGSGGGLGCENKNPIKVTLEGTKGIVGTACSDGITTSEIEAQNKVQRRLYGAGQTDFNPDVRTLRIYPTKEFVTPLDFT